MELNRLNDVIILSVGMLFLFFTYLQINDPDSTIWIIVYFIPSVLSFIALTNYRNKYFQYLAPIYLIIAIYLYLNNSHSIEMHLFDESTNESLGLLICSVWIFILPRFNNHIIVEEGKVN